MKLEDKTKYEIFKERRDKKEAYICEELYNPQEKNSSGHSDLLSRYWMSWGEQ